MAGKQLLPVEHQQRSTWWEGTEDMTPFPFPHNPTCPADHTMPLHTLRSTGCPIADSDRLGKRSLDVSIVDILFNPHYLVRREKALCVSQVQVLSGELPACAPADRSGHPSSDQDDQKGN